MTEDVIRADETARVTDKVLDEIGIEASRPPPLPLLLDLIEDVAFELGISLTDHEKNYIAKTNIGWVYDGINSDNIDKHREMTKRNKDIF